MSHKKFGSVMPGGPGKDLDPYISSLIGEDTDTFSEREKKRVESASDFGEVYWCTIETGTLDDGSDREFIELRTDLGEYGTDVVLRVDGSNISASKMALAAATFVSEIMDC